MGVGDKPPTILRVYPERKHLSDTWEGRMGAEPPQKLLRRSHGAGSSPQAERGTNLQGAVVPFRTEITQLVANTIWPGRWQQNSATKNVGMPGCVGTPPSTFLCSACHAAKSALLLTGDHVPHEGACLSPAMVVGQWETSSL